MNMHPFRMNFSLQIVEWQYIHSKKFSEFVFRLPYTI